MPTATKTPAKKAPAKKAAETTTDDRQYTYATGKRKTSVARVCLYAGGSGKVTINDLDLKKYFATGQQISSVFAPFKIAAIDAKGYDIVAKVAGGGLSSQAEAVRHGVATGLTREDAGRRVELKRVGFLTRDSRVKERKKPGLKRARRSPQWAKR